MRITFGKNFPTHFSEFEKIQNDYTNYKNSLIKQHFACVKSVEGINSKERKWKKEIWEKKESWVLLAAKIVGCALLYVFSDFNKSFHENLKNWNEVWNTGKLTHSIKLQDNFFVIEKMFSLSDDQQNLICKFYSFGCISNRRDYQGNCMK